MKKSYRILFLILILSMLCCSVASAGFFNWLSGFLINEGGCGDGYCSAKELSGYGNWGECPEDCAGRLTPAEYDMYIEAPDAENPKALYDAVSGNIFLAWEEDDSIYGQIVDVQGKTILDKFMISYVGEKAYDLQVDIDDNKAYVVWAVDGTTNKIKLKTYDFEGAQLDVKTITSTSAEVSSPDIAALDYEKVVTWLELSAKQKSNGPFEYTWKVRGSFLETGKEDAAFIVATVTDDTKTNNGLSSPRVAVSDKQVFLVTWTDWTGADTSGAGIYAQEYYLKTQGGGPKVKGNPFRVNTNKAGDQKNADCGYTKNGYFVVTWESQTKTYGDTNIVIKRFRPNHRTKDDEITVSTGRSGNQKKPSLITNKHYYMVNWQGGGNEDGYGYGIFSQYFNVNGKSVGTNELVNVYGEGNQEQPNIAYFDDDRALHVWTGLQKYGTEGITLRIL